HGLAFEIGCEGFVIGLLAIGAYLSGALLFGGEAVGSTMCFQTLGLAQLVHAFNAHTSRSLFRVSPFSNRHLNFAFFFSAALLTGVVLFPVTRALFAVTALSPGAWGVSVGLSLVPIAFTELYKRLMGRS
ncbi:MAG: cation-translocating P-type ATPase C-terminal domain-containing protein, partial [Clostridia bacterium]|nr:cation-translocating P-type ATPase C-terminal domain-containing protein [Clostridia bacterium]